MIKTKTTPVVQITPPKHWKMYLQSQSGWEGVTLPYLTVTKLEKQHSYFSLQTQENRYSLEYSHSVSH